jgi:peptidoglycan glycosyltransferase
VTRFGTAAGIFRSSDLVAAKTGTAQTGNTANNTHDWMIAFAPANNPVVAVAVVVPFQHVDATGAAVAGPIMRCVIQGAIALSKGQPASGTSSTCPR